MTFAYCTNIWSHHQGCVCRELATLLGNDFKMVMFQPLDCEWSRERMEMGWNLLPPDEPWCIGPPKNDIELTAGNFNKYMLDADVAVIGISPYMDVAAIKQRIKLGKLTFIMGERYFKKEKRWYDFINPRQWRRWAGLHFLLSPKNVHFLTMNHWCADDLAFLRVCKGRTWRWGYLTEVSLNEPSERRNAFIKIGWAGRMMACKQVDMIIEALACLPLDVRQKCRLELLGDGEMRTLWQQKAKKNGIDTIVEWGTLKAHDEFLRWLRRIDVYVFPSNRIEGWGATLVEAMDAGCAVIANAEAGATLEVVKDGENGFVFFGNDVGMLTKSLWVLIKDARLRKRLGQSAWQTIQEWAPKIGAERISSLASDLLEDGRASCSYRGLCQNIR